MRIVTHQTHLNQLPTSPLKIHLQTLFDQLSAGTDVPPNILVLEYNDKPNDPELSFLGSNGMCSDLFESHQPGEPDFASVFEWISYLPDLKIYEMLYLEADFGYWLIVPEELVETNPTLHAVINSHDLFEPQPMH